MGSVRILALGAACALAIVLVGCSKRDDGGTPPARAGMSVVTTLFPLYDFARNVAGDRADVTLLLPPGMEPHSFEPRPEDVVRVSRARVFVYTNRIMEPWAADILKGVGGGGPLVVDASRGARLLPAAENHDHGGHRDGEHDEARMDPHLWLDFANAQRMVDNIAAGMAERDPANREAYLANAAAYKAKLADLDERYRRGLASCSSRVVVHGGHFAFGYLADRYGLRYEAAFAASADAEPTPAKLAALVKRIRAEGVRTIYTEELIDPRTAETIARETGAAILPLHGAHTVSRDDLARGVTFMSLMEKNLENLRKGLQCR
ncbi:metal ABC transporter substrate-binding protein [Geobacter anodireducens]|uniref:metal ABC transporter substrate-binding protein n=1 Tax=Geobacter soli TaxID=1510391 RepID=UPI000690E38F|nr:metal ABC transporter substrate-binding protein [Geobacter soli]